MKKIVLCVFCLCVVYAGFGLEMQVKDPIPCETMDVTIEDIVDDGVKGSLIISVDEKANICFTAYCRDRIASASLPAKKQVDLKKICSKATSWIKSTLKSGKDDTIFLLPEFKDDKGRMIRIDAMSFSEYRTSDMTITLTDNKGDDKSKMIVVLELDGIKKLENCLSALGETYKKLKEEIKAASKKEDS